jgi:cytochrome c oxidase subunit 3/cytochrome o ubiquinol oxidase subunit 3
MALVEHGQAGLIGSSHGHDSHGHGLHISTEQKNYMLKFGWWAYIASEIMLFASLIGVFLLAKRLHPEAGNELNVPLTTLNTFLLLVSSWTMVRALASLHANDIKGLQRELFLTMALGATFIGVMMFEYVELSHHGVTLTSDIYGSAFYVMTGFHGAHVAIGVLWLAWAWYKALGGYFTPEKYIGIEVLGLYWHFVDVVWIFIFPLAYLL